ncbi:peptidoglycan-binding domain-containing protein [Streptomyces sp. B1866]|uniref:peptidoglycan-binding domain-containing protein n=1 Tax=Streptomyces sp. B1866 TaxID=3075431 RepID=UPI002890ABC9|nr:peptidoglycan-binding domain-containing protein [Streptomyces sp. B1866]MDT3395601.1 peptidoglycan-binding domain-containing protein [Streptomyces sp. B1866]
MPGAAWRPIPVNHTRGGQQSVHGVVVHIMDGSYGGTDSWFRNPDAEASAHFGTSRAGALCQWVDTADRAWAQAGGNRTWLSVENEGRGGDTLTDAQLDRCAAVLAWAHTTHSVPLQIAGSPSGRGLGHHAMGGSAWGGHTSCPGPRVVAQLPEIVRRAQKLTGKPAPGKPAPYTPPTFPPGLGPNKAKPSARPLQRALKAAGYLPKSVQESDNYGPATQAAVARFHNAHPQYRAKGKPYDPAIGPHGWAHLFRLAHGR